MEVSELQGVFGGRRKEREYFGYGAARILGAMEEGFRGQEEWRLLSDEWINRALK